MLGNQVAGVDEKTVAWHTGARSLEKHGVPREFTTTSRVIIICNDWKTLNNNVSALQDRGHVLVFQPSAAEVHRKAGAWFKDREPDIYDWFGNNLHRMVAPSFRHYVRAGELKAAGMVWTEVLELEEENSRARLAAEILASDAYQTTMGRRRQRQARTGHRAEGGGPDRAGNHRSLDSEKFVPSGRRLEIPIRPLWLVSGSKVL